MNSTSTLASALEWADTFGWTVERATAGDFWCSKGERRIIIYFRRDGKISRAWQAEGVRDERTQLRGRRAVYLAMQSDSIVPRAEQGDRRERALLIVKNRAWPQDPISVCLIAVDAWGPFKTERHRYAACVRGLREAGLMPYQPDGRRHGHRTDRQRSR